MLAPYRRMEGRSLGKQDDTWTCAEKEMLWEGTVQESLRRPLLSSLQITVRRVTNMEKSPRLYVDVFALFNHQNKETIIFES